jgi:asparagine synthase (glutamine-hydrolysing)
MPASLPWIGRGHLLSQLPAIADQPFGRYYYANFEYLSDDRKRDAVLTQRRNLEDTASYLQNLYDASDAHNVRDGLAAVDFRTQLAEEFLFMTDRFSMAHSLEARVPFLDPELVETVFRVPSSIRTKNSDLKYLLKKAVGDLLPKELLTARKKGFVIPIELWLRRDLRPLAERLLNPQRLREQGLFNPEFYNAYVLPHLDGKATYTWQVWAALMFQLWHLVVIEQNQMETPAYSWKELC